MKHSTAIHRLIVSSVAIWCLPAVPPLAAQGRRPPGIVDDPGIRVERTDLTGKWVVPVAGGRIAPGEPADLFILNAAPNGSPAIGAPSRRMIHGQWN